jgi:hypothetical protein
MTKKKKYTRKIKGVKDKTELFLWVKPETKEHVKKMSGVKEMTMSKYVESVLSKDLKRHSGKSYPTTI